MDETADKNIVEHLLDHFFSSVRPSYDTGDVLYFLKLANNQKQWCQTKQFTVKKVCFFPK